MEERIEKIIEKYYAHHVPKIKDVILLDESPELGITCIRWSEGDKKITVKSILQGDEIVITELK
ncbi:hypothetical protein UFOVP972_91 [uncultured Caudovirales phage]|uniref:Uncharacterized protein n=1 Tax=uncultured Caudovirales phage TaxID=2100421 RepID=A0A6J5Q5R3_9CAUD|nr:hypothetical protein UFOVP972_91 [uncultured Caudovirales phage]